MLVREFDVHSDICSDIHDAIEVNTYLLSDIALYIDEYNRVWTESDWYIADVVDPDTVDLEDMKMLGACDVMYMKKMEV